MLGEFVTDVQYNGASHRRLPVVVVKGSAPCLLGRNWLERMQICWSEVHALRAPPMERLKRKYPTVFSSQLGKLKNVKVKLDIDSSVAPKFCKARSLPFAYKSRVEAQLKGVARIFQTYRILRNGHHLTGAAWRKGITG